MKQETPEERTPQEQLLHEEASQYYNMAKEYRRDRYLKEGSEAFIINKVWLKKWKEYVNYSFIKKNIQYSYYYSQYNNKKYEPMLDSHPGEINNSALLVPFEDFLNDGDKSNPENLVIRHEINQRLEVKIVNKDIWAYLHGKYGGGPVIKKGSIEEKSKYSSSAKKIVELYYRKYNFVLFPKRRAFSEEKLSKIKIETMYISRVKKLSELKLKLINLTEKREIYSEGINEKNIRLWKLNSQASLETFKQVFMNKAAEIKENDTQFKCNDLLYSEYNENCTLDELELAETDICVVEYSNDNSPWIFEIKKIEQKEGKCEWCNLRKMLKYCCICKDIWYCKEDCMEKDKNFHKDRCKKRFEVEESVDLIETENTKKGLVGLQNLGNTCFMNTSLQCISNCYEVTQYFLKDHYKKDINPDNPIGTGGVLARAYANFLKNVWYGESGVFSPWNFKKAISTFQAMFTGYQQHDTQEFLNYLLDGLHEDINRVLKKPLVEKDDANKEDSIKSNEQWIGFLRRNQSSLVDLLYGQYKSTLHCPDTECQNVSTTFDPFLSVSLPLVAKTETYETMCFFIFYDIKLKPLQMSLPFSTETTIMALRNKIAKMLNIHPFSFFVIKMDKNGNYDHIVNSSALIKTNTYYQSDNQKPFFLFQIDPDLFYSKYNKFCLADESLISMKRDFNSITQEMETRDEENKKLFSDDYEEDESGVTSETLCYYSRIEYNMANGRKQVGTMRVNVDDNFGFGPDFLKTVVLLKKYEVGSYNSTRQRIIFPRIIYLDKKWTLKQAHFYVFKYFSTLIRTHHKLDETEYPDDRLWLKFFDNLNTENSNDSYEYQSKNLWPYRLRLKNVNESSRFGNCYFCDSSSCTDCLLPYSDEITIGELAAKIPKNEDFEIDNTFLYLNRQRFTSLSNKDLQLEVTWLPEYNETVHNLNDKRDYDFAIIRSAKQKSVSIYDCFRNFVKLEKLEENNEWYCPECKKHQKATKKMEIYNSPHILIIHLKRFRNNSKIDTTVDFPINGLDISSYVISKENNLPQIYDLFAIANHYGGMGFGHYISFAKNPINKQWYEFDDSHVTRKEEGDLINSSAYVLFYRRRGLENYINTEEIYNKNFVNYESGAETGSTNNTNMTNNITQSNAATSNNIQEDAIMSGVNDTSIHTNNNDVIMTNLSSADKQLKIKKSS